MEIEGSHLITIKLNEIDETTLVSSSDLESRREPHEIFSNICNDIEKLGDLLTELKDAEEQGDKKQLLRLLVRKEERINRMDRCLSHFQQGWETSGPYLEKKLAIAHKLRAGLQALKESANLQQLLDIKKDLSQFREFFTVSSNTECNRNTKHQSTAEQNMTLYKAYHDARA